ncbi:MAG TPA: acyl-CoA dehydrogenase family protein, partial [Acidimicrobiia bacterium]
MSHYLPNLRDLEFNLFEIHRVHEYSPIDRSTAEDLVREAARFAAGPWAQSFEASDRAPLLLDDGEVSLPPALLSSLRKGLEGGWDRVGLPSELGGVPVPSVLFWCLQDLFLGANPAAAFYSTGPYFASILYAEGTDEQKQLARLMVERAWGATMVLTEPDAGSDVGAATTKAIPVGDDTYHLEGVKRFITSGEHDASENIIHFVLARPVGAVAGTKGLSLFVVPKFLVKVDGTLGERNGVKATRLEHKLGLRGSATCELTFGQDRPAVGFLLGGVHDGIRQMFRVIEHARMTIGAKSAATLSTGYLNALGYARERVQGPDLALATDKSSPRVPILRHPDVRRMLMLQKCHSEGMRALLTY